MNNGGVSLKNSRIVLQAFVSVVLAAGLVLPPAAAGAAPAVHHSDARSFGQLVMDSWSDASVITVSPVRGQVPPMVAAGVSHTVGLEFDGTVVAVGWDYYDQCDGGGWTDIVHVA